MSRRWHLDSFTPSNISILATALDPRFRQLCFLTEEQRDLIQTELLLRNNEDESTEPPSPKKNKTAFDFLLGEEDDACTSFTTEVSQFITEKPISHDNDALEWWKMNASRFPRLAEIARRLLCVPASSTASERLFSTAGLTVSKIRNSLKPENVDALLFLNKNCSLLRL